MEAVIRALWRHPVKSLLGEPLEEAVLGESGIEGDRAYALRDRETGLLLSAKRWHRLFEFSARYPEGPSGPPELLLPGGESPGEKRALEAISAAVGRKVELARAWDGAEEAIGVARDGGEDVIVPPRGTFFDSGVFHLMSQGALDALKSAYAPSDFDVRRFRANALLEGGPAEEAWVGREAALGEARVFIHKRTRRCVMTTLPQSELPKDPGILRAVARETGGVLGVHARVLKGGRIRLGQPLSFNS